MVDHSHPHEGQFGAYLCLFSEKGLAIFWEEGYLLMFLFHCRDVKILLQYGWSY